MLKLDFDDLTLDEVELIEELTGREIGEAYAAGKPKGKALKVFLWIMQRRINPNYSIEDAGKLTIGETLAAIEGINEKKVK